MIIRKLEGIEALRGLAVLMTVFAHLPITTAPFVGSSIRSPWFMGVPIFFGISGWIIAHVTDKLTDENVPEFLLKRLFRIVPVLLATSFLSILLSIALPRSDVVNQFYPDIFTMLRVVASNLLFISDFAPSLGIQTPLSMLGLWSIAVEVKFYLVFGLIMFLPRRVRIHTLVALLVLALCYRYTLVRQANSLGYSHVFFIESMLLGAISRELNLQSFVSRLRKSLIGFLSLLCFSYLLIFPSIPHTGLRWLLFYIIEVACCVLLVNCASSVAVFPKSYLSGFFKWFGARSYSLYVFHFQFLAWAGVAAQIIGLNFSSPRLYDFALVMSLFLCLPVLAFIHNCIELPCVDLSKKISKNLRARSH